MPDHFVFPGSVINDQPPVWGLKDGIRVGLAPTPGPRGLLRIYTPYLDQPFPRVVNFFSLEPTVEGDARLHTERFPDSALPIVAVRFDANRPHEVELRTYAATDSSEMESCVLSATMGNFGLLRELRLKDQTIHASQLWEVTETVDSLDFSSWRDFTASELTVLDDGTLFFEPRPKCRGNRLSTPPTLRPG